MTTTRNTPARRARRTALLLVGLASVDDSTQRCTLHRPTRDGEGTGN